jgi:hypothetical protein
MLTVLFISTATAGPFEATLDAARDKMASGELAAAAGYIRAARFFAPESSEVLDADQLGRIWLYRGMIAAMIGEDEDKIMDLWRQAFVISPALQWDEIAMASGPERDLYEALRQESKGGSRVDALIPERYGAAKLYVDGNKRIYGDGVYAGEHLAQIECPDEQGTFGIWTDFSERKFDWLSLCPDGVNIAAAAAPADDYEYGPRFGIAASPEQEAAEPLPPVAVEQRISVSMPLLLSAGGAALVSGGLYAAALNSRSQFDDLNNPALQIPDDVSTLRRQTNTRVYLSAGTGAFALGLYTVAFLDLDF